MPALIKKLRGKKVKFEKGMRALSLLLVIALVGGIFVPAVSAEDGKLDEKLFVDSDYAEKVAELHLIKMSRDLSEYADWENSKLTKSIIFYRDEQNVSAYLYNVIKDDNYLGFILVSANRDNHPVLAFGKGYLIDERSTNLVENSAKKFANEKNYIMGGKIYYYLGPTFYFVRYNLSDIKSGSVEEYIFYDLFTGNAVRSNFSVTLQEGESQQCSDESSLKAINEWEIIDNEIYLVESGVKASSLMRGTSDLISGVPKYNQPSGTTNYCSPTAAGMVFGYWDSHGYPGLPSGDTAIMALGTAMGTTSSGTDQYKIDDGMKTVFSNYGYSYFNVVEDIWIFF